MRSEEAKYSLDDLQALIDAAQQSDARMFDYNDARAKLRDVAEEVLPALIADLRSAASAARLGREQNERLKATIHNKEAALEVYRMEVEQLRAALESILPLAESRGNVNRDLEVIRAARAVLRGAAALGEEGV